MTLPGGAAAKIGNRYETWWTLSEFVRMLHGDTEAIRLEVPGIDKAEFVVTTGSKDVTRAAKPCHSDVPENCGTGGPISASQPVHRTAHQLSP